MKKHRVAAADADSAPRKNHIAILDFIRALAMIRIFMFHYYLEWFGGSFQIIPEGLAANLSRLWVFRGDEGGPLDWAAALMQNLFSWLFLYGFSTVNVFLVLSGFVLTYSLMVKGGLDCIGKAKTLICRVKEWFVFYWKRMKRILIPFYISVILGIGFWYCRNLFFPQFADWPLFDWIDLGKLLVVPYLFFDILLLQKFNGDYWFIVLIFQLYLLFPLLFYLLKRTGVYRFLLLTLALTLAYRVFAGMYLDGVPMGVAYPSEHSYRVYSFFLPRLFEFSFGMALGYLYYKKESLLESWGGIKWFLAGFAATVAGYVLLMYRSGWVISDAVLGFGLFFVLFGIAGVLSRNGIIKKTLQNVGEAAYEIYLLHHYFLNYILMYALVVLGLKGNPVVFWGLMPVYFGAVILIGYFGKYLSKGSEWVYWKMRGPKKKT